MKKQNYINALLILLWSLASLFVGFWIGEYERRQIAESFVNNVVSSNEQNAFDARKDVNMLTALEEGDIEHVIKSLRIRLKSRLQPMPRIGNPVVDKLIALYEPSEETVAKAKAYQTKYCLDRCLGI